MTTTAQPYGLRPSSHPSGTIRPVAYTIATGYAVNIFQNQPVRIAPATGRAKLKARSLQPQRAKLSLARSKAWSSQIATAAIA